MDLSGPSCYHGTVDLVWAVVAWGAWIAALAATHAWSGRDPRSGTATPRGCPPVPSAVRDVLRRRPADDVFRSALADLARQGRLTLEDEHVSRPAPPGPEPWPYESWVLRQVTARLSGERRAPVGAVVPEGRELEKAFLPLVRECACALGLARPRWRTKLVPLLLTGGLLVPWTVTLALVRWGFADIVCTVAALGIGTVLWTSEPRLFLTPLGRSVIGPSPAAQVPPIAPEPVETAGPSKTQDDMVWSAQRGDWRRVRVDRTPATDPPWIGIAVSPPIAMLGGLFAWIFDDWPPRIAALAMLVGGLAGTAFFAVRLLRERGTPRRAEVAGKVVERWVHVVEGEQSRTYVPHLAVDDGTSDSARSYQVVRDFYERVVPGDSVRLLVDPRRGRVLQVLEHRRHG